VYPINVNDLVYHRHTGKLAIVTSIDGPASASNPLSHYPMTIEFIYDKQQQSFQYGYKDIIAVAKVIEFRDRL
jgi:hypothetical protein